MSYVMTKILKTIGNILYIIVLLTFIGCQRGDDISDYQEKRVASSYISELNDLCDKYCEKPSGITSNIRKSGGVNGWSIAAHDGLGALAGAKMFVKWTRNPYVLGGAALIGAAICSYAEYAEQAEAFKDVNENHINKAFYKDCYFVDRRAPISTIRSLDELQAEILLENIIGYEVGVYHNFIISQLMKNDKYGMPSNETLDDIFKSVSNIANDYKLGSLESDSTFCETYPQFAKEVFAQHLDCPIENKAIDDILNLYEKHLLHVQLGEQESFSKEFMRIVDKAFLINRELSYEEAFTINATISVWRKSEELWKALVPRLTEAHVLLCQNKVDSTSWIIKIPEDDNWGQKIETYIKTSEIVDFGIAKVIDGEITEVFFYRDIFKQLGYPKYESYLFLKNDITIKSIKIDDPCDKKLVKEIPICGVYKLQNISDMDNVKYVSLNKY